MAQLAREQIDTLLTTITREDYLRRLRDEIGELHRIVFHRDHHIDWDLVRHSAEQILMSEIVCRYQGRPEGVLAALRAAQSARKSWDAAVHEQATAMHSYFTTPLGMVMRQDLFGADAVFIIADAYDWVAQQREPTEPGPAGKP